MKGAAVGLRPVFCEFCWLTLGVPPLATQAAEPPTYQVIAASGGIPNVNR